MSQLKAEEGQLHAKYVDGSDTDDSELIHDANISAFTEAEQRAIIWRVDLRLVLTLGFMYYVSLMDRSNMSFAIIAGMGVDLNLIGERYSVIAIVFFGTYIFLQPVATVILRRVGPRAFLPAICFGWGVTMIGFGFVRVWSTMIPLRLLLGLFEAGFFPGCAYLLSCWYPRYDLQKRNAAFYVVGLTATAFSGILAYGFSQMNGLGHSSTLGQHVGPTKQNPHATLVIKPGIAGWRWIFIMEGVLTCLIALVSFFTIVDFPELAASRGCGPKFLNQKEVAFVVARIEKDRHDAIPEKFSLRRYLRNAADLKIWAFGALFGLSTTSTYAIAYFLPIILKNGMGFSTAKAQCLSAPPYLLASIVMYAMAWYGDKWHIRSPFVVINGCLGLIGTGLLGLTHNVGLRYFGVFLATTAANANIPVVLTWQANNIRGQWKRALSSATLVGTGGIGGIIGSTVFRQRDSPVYHPGIYTCMIANGLIILIAVLLVLKFHRANQRAERGDKIIEGLKGFRYTL